MGRYGPAPDAAPPPPPPTDDDRTRWSVRRKVLAILASVGMVAAFVFNFLAPTSSGFKKDTTTTSSKPGVSSTAPSTTSTTNIPGGVVDR